MSILQIILITIGLAMDCFAVSVTKGMVVGNRWKTEWKRVLLMAVLFGVFQGLMPLIGFWGGSICAEIISRFDHWIALVLLVLIGGKMIWESFHEDNTGTQHAEHDGLAVRTLFLLAIATSIDALAMGIIFVPTPEVIVWTVAIIALVSFLFSLTGFMIGAKFGATFRLNVELIGGLILIGIGIKIFVEHMFFS